MAKFGGVALRVVSTGLYLLTFLCAGIVLGIYSYFLAAQAQRNVGIPNWQKAVEGISGAGALYTLLATVLTCCLGGFAFFAFLGIFLDVLFVGAFIALAVLTRDGRSCSGNSVQTPFGDGNPNSHIGRDGKTFTASLFTACRLNTAAFAVSLIGAFLFLLSALLQFWLGRHHQREKRYGPSPQNNYSSGSGIRFFKRRRGARSAHAAAAKDAEAGTISSTGVGDGTYVGNKYETAPVQDYHQTTGTHIPVAGGYHTGPQGTAVNPYGYDNTHRTAGTNF